MLNYEQILDLIERFEGSSLSLLELRQEGFRLRLEQGSAPEEGRHSHAELESAPHVPTPSPSGILEPGERLDSPLDGQARAGADEAVEAGHRIDSPIVGTFYAAPSPEAAPFVAVGDRVEIGQVICIVEAMKMMNEIEADASGEVTRILAENGEPIGHGDPILVLRTDGI